MASTSEDEENEARLLCRERRYLLDQLRAEGITDERVLGALRQVPREEFVAPELRSLAYQNRPLPIGNDQTISQPYIVALMTELCELTESSRVLEVGTGSGYQTAVLSLLASKVYTVEIVEPLATLARTQLERVGLGANVSFRIGDGRVGWPEAAPFDAILVAAAPHFVPLSLVNQLRYGGKLVIPVGPPDSQTLRVVTRHESGQKERDVVAVRFVPLMGGSRAG